MSAAIDPKVLDGKAVAKAIRLEVKDEVAEWTAASGFVPGLEVVLIGEDPASAVYVRNKERAAKRAGIRSVTHRLPAETTQAEALALLDRLNDDPEVDGILVQLPLPDHLDSRALLDRVDPAKDVDGFHPDNVGRLVQNREALVACTPAGVMQMLEREGIPVSGAHAVVVGRSDIVGKPMSTLLLHANATVTTCHSRTRDLASITSQADILIAAVGRLAMLGAEHVKEGAVVIDVGIHRIEDRATVERLFAAEPERLEAFAAKGAVLAGDVDYHAVLPKAARITPVPGGVGPLTIAMLLANTLAAAKARRG